MLIAACRRFIAADRVGWRKHGDPADLELVYSFHPDADWIELTTVHKGGLFGSDYRMLFPADGIEGIRRFYLDTLIGFGKRGLACQPAIVGVGLGGSKDISMVLGKQAACRSLGKSGARTI